MLSYTTTYEDPSNEITKGLHENQSDSPVLYEFTVLSAKGASSEQIRADIEAALAGAGRTGFTSVHDGEPEIIMKDTVTGKCFRLTVDSLGVITTEEVT